MMINTNFLCYRCMNKIEKATKRCPICGCEIINEKLLDYSLTPGTLLKQRYTVGHVINKNKKALTYIGLDEHLESKIIVLELFPEDFVTRMDCKVLAKSKEMENIFNTAKEEFFKLYQILVKLRVLPSIVKVFAIFEENNTIYVVHELFRGISFTKYLSNNYGELSWNQSKKMFLDLIKLLRHIHNYKIIHSDLTPNTLFVENNTLKIIDFSNAKLEDSKIIENTTKLNDGYSAPEQYDNKQIGTYTDVYSLASIMYKSLTGTKPVNSKSRLSNDNLLPPNVLNSKIQKNISFAIMSALVLAPKLRTQTMKDFYEDLTAPPRENIKNLPTEPVVQFEEEEEEKEEKTKITKKKAKRKNKQEKTSKEKKEPKTRNLVLFSFLISCSIASFFLIIAIFLLFNENIFN